MGFPNSKHIKFFVKDKTVRDIYSDEKNKMAFIVFTDGTKLRLYDSGSDGMIASPFRLDGEWAQCTSDGKCS